MRFLFLRGDTPVALADVILTPPGWRPGSLPRAVPIDRVARLLAVCDRGTATGRRDHAILIVLARLGLRAGEVGALGWRTSTGGRGS